ncbi:DUF885 domain-containing protein [Arenimonas sp. GDDSR-1]|uniref:DUF885 domain-containing protein n=1 Tax=Arenimonas sp. GDDSR-1 TaxID=2950125 RepID=UPI002631D3BA|nr:DUF885 domain-containing protein [Arenimonas sp. GDDSR-1]
MRFTALLLLLLTLIPAAHADDGHAALHRLFAEEWERGLRESPENAAYNGDMRFNDRWSDLSLKAIADSEAADRAAMARLHAIDRKALSAQDQLHYDTFEWLLNKDIERQPFREYLMPMTHQGGVQTADGITELLAFSTEKDYRDWLARMDALPVLIEQTLALMREGVRSGRTPPKAIMTRVPAQIAAQLVTDPEKSGFFAPFKRYPESFTDAQRAALSKEARTLITGKIVPAYARLGEYFNAEYLPATRSSIAATDLPDGKAYYDLLARYYTTTALSADEIHGIGLKEVARIRARMEAVKAETGFKGSLPEFFSFLRSDPRFFYTSPEALLEGYQAMSKRIDPELVKVFGVLPRLTYGVRAIPASIAPDTTTAYYQGGATDGTRPGYYYVNLYKPEVRPKWEMLPLSLHEAVPGHHFQFARGMELPEMPMFRRTAYFVAYGEGWGLYAEQLGYDMGLYDDPYDRMGQLTYEMWRAVRLVVDTGMHAKGWTRQQAIDYFKANAPKTDQDIVNEIDRYIGTPGQALAYKIGQLKISELRARAQGRLGARFNLRAFHDEVLGTGSVPLDTLEKHMDAWIAAQAAQ